MKKFVLVIFIIFFIFTVAGKQSFSRDASIKLHNMEDDEGHPSPIRKPLTRGIAYSPPMPSLEEISIAESRYKEAPLATDQVWVHLISAFTTDVEVFKIQIEKYDYEGTTWETLSAYDIARQLDRYLLLKGKEPMYLPRIKWCGGWNSPQHMYRFLIPGTTKCLGESQDLLPYIEGKDEERCIRLMIARRQLE